MWSFIDGYINYIKIGLAIFVACGIFYTGFHMGNSRYLEYKASVEATAKEQEVKVQSIQKEHELVTKGIQDEYEAKLAAVHNYYRTASVWNKPSSGTVPSLSKPPSVTDVITSYNELAGQCAQTTLQLVELQKWMNAQMGIE